MDSNDAMRKPAPAAPPQSLATCALVDLTWLVGSALERLASLERRVGSAWQPREESAERLQRLVRDVATAGNGTELSELARRVAAVETAIAAAGEHQPGDADLGELIARVSRLERLVLLARPAPPGEHQPQGRLKPAQAAHRQSAGGPLRQAIANILRVTPGVDAKTVLGLLAGSAGGRTKPSLRTVRWHLQQLRCNKTRGHHRPPAFGAAATARG